MRKLNLTMLLLCALMSFTVTPGTVIAAPVSTEDETRIAFAKALFPEDIMFGETTLQAKNGLRDALGKGELADFAKSHPGFRDDFESSANQLIDDVVGRSMSGLYEQMAERLRDADPEQLRRVAVFLNSPAGKKYNRTIVTFVFEKRRRTGSQPTSTALDAAVIAGLNKAELKFVERFAATPDGRKYVAIGKEAVPGIEAWVQATRPLLDQKLSQLATSEGQKFVNPK